MIIPEYLLTTFDWLDKPKSGLHVANDAKWLMREIIYIIFNSESTLDKKDDSRVLFLNSLKNTGCSETEQVQYVNDIAECLAKAVKDTPLPKEKKVWLGEVSAQTKKLNLLLKEIPKNELPLNWGNLLSLTRDAISASELKGTVLEDIQESLKNGNLYGALSKTKQAHGLIDLVAVLNLLNEQSKKLSSKSALDFYMYPQKFFRAIADDKTLLLAFQRSGILAISKTNKAYFGMPHDTLTSHILSCIFQKEISNKNVKKIRETLNVE